MASDSINKADGFEEEGPSNTPPQAHDVSGVTGGEIRNEGHELTKAPAPEVIGDADAEGAHSDSDSSASDDECCESEEDDEEHLELYHTYHSEYAVSRRT